MSASLSPMPNGQSRPKEFAKNGYDLSDSEDESNVGKLPPSDSEEE
jgi:probable RNA-binding protein EIF1AD